MGSNCQHTGDMNEIHDASSLGMCVDDVASQDMVMMKLQGALDQNILYQVCGSCSQY